MRTSDDLLCSLEEPRASTHRPSNPVQTFGVQRSAAGGAIRRRTSNKSLSSGQPPTDPILESPASRTSNAGSHGSASLPLNSERRTPNAELQTPNAKLRTPIASLPDEQVHLAGRFC